MQKVAGLTVRSNVSSLKNCTEAAGNIEFWPGNYGPSNSLSVAGASATIYDIGDQGVDPVPGYGSMQVHHTGAKQTVFALNHWGSNGIVDVGIGNSSGRTRDWTFTATGKNYRTIRLSVMVK